MPNRTVMGNMQAQIPPSLNLAALFYSRNPKIQYPSRVMELRHCNIAEHQRVALSDRVILIAFCTNFKQRQTKESLVFILTVF